ncbi:hypothetical protein Btru_006821 [Bulinus truncatus]|nr:hypothetical protein Btru_006821 [Bulinus truncatus]
MDVDIVEHDHRLPIYVVLSDGESRFPCDAVKNQLTFGPRTVFDVKRLGTNWESKCRMTLNFISPFKCELSQFQCLNFCSFCGEDFDQRNGSFYQVAIRKKKGKDIFIKALALRVRISHSAHLKYHFDG